MAPYTKSYLKRSLGNKPDNRVIYYMAEGTVTETGFLRDLFSKNSFFNKCSFSFQIVNRTGKELGKNGLEQMINAMLEQVINKPSFKKGKDKAVIIFDLDRYVTDKDYVNSLIAKYKDNILFVYSYPSFDLFLLLADHGNYEKIIEPHMKEIMANNYYDEINKIRMIPGLLKEKYSIDVKCGTTDFKYFVDRIENCCANESAFIENHLDDFGNRLISNVGRVLKHLQNDNVEMEYYRKKK